MMKYSLQPSHSSAVGSYHRISFPVDSAEDDNGVNLDGGGPKEHTGRLRCRIIALSLLVVVLVVVFFTEFGPTIAYVRGSSSPSTETSGGSDVEDLTGGDLSTEEPKDDGDDIIRTNELKEDVPVNGGADDEEAGVVGVDWSEKEIQKRCPRWSESFTKKFKEECAYWIPVFTSWEATLNAKPTPRTAVYSCETPALCHGWGDRVAGMGSAFSRALLDRRRFAINHPHLPKLFEPCLFNSSIARWTSQKYTRSKTHDCYDNTVDCERWNWVKCPKTNLVAMNADKGCMAPRFCKQLSTAVPRYSMATLFGCGMRAMFEPTDQFLEKLRFPFRTHTQRKTTMMTLKEIEMYLAAFHVIAIHVRLGDAYAFPNGGEGTPPTKDLMRPIRCAQTLKSYLETNEQNGNGHGESSSAKQKQKGIVFLVATDTDSYKKEIIRDYGDLVAGFDFEPRHMIATNGRTFIPVAKELAEWLIIGKANDLVTTTWSDAGDIYGDTETKDNRLSAFSKSAWLYNLKSSVYLAGTCKAFPVTMDGNHGRSPSVCEASPVLKESLLQPHLKPLHDANVQFPKYYVLNGKVEPSTAI